MGTTRQIVRMLDRWGQAEATVRNRLHSETESEAYPFLEALAGPGGIVAGQVVYLTATGTVLPADADNPAHAGFILGLAANNAIEDEVVRVLSGGVVYRAAWALVAGAIYWLGNAGELTDTAPMVGFVQRIGVARDATMLAVCLGEPVIRA